MLKSYFKTTWRNFKKNKLFSFINILGLSVGLTCCLLMTLYISNETSYDAYHKNASTIYQVGTEFIGLGNALKLPNTPAAMGEHMMETFPEIQRITRLGSFYGEDKTALQYNAANRAGKTLYEKGYFADSNFFQIFTYNLIEGDAGTALTNPNTVVLSEATAKKLFGSEHVLNKVIHISSDFNGDHDFLVTGIFRPGNKLSHSAADFFAGMNGGGMEDFIKKQGSNLAVNYLFYTYLQLKPEADASKLEHKFPSFIQQVAGNDLKAVGFSTKQFLVPLKKIHLNESVKDNITLGGSSTSLYVLGSIALFTLLIACVNFMNLVTAQSSKRAAEVGIRKVLGARRKSLVGQFLGEAVLMSCAALASI